MDNFYQSTQDQPHPSRTRAILQKHPEIGELFGNYPPTFFVMLGVLGLQVGISAWLGLTGQAWWLALILAYAVGAFCNHCMYVIIHEATHNLVFRNVTLNKITAVMADMCNVFPGSIGFRTYHIQHHAHQGDYDYDADMANHWEARFIGNSFLGKAFWLLLFPLFQLTRPPRLKAINMWNTWVWINLAACVAFDVAIFYFFGFTGFLYFLASFFFSIGLHPVGGRWIQEHYILPGTTQETYSYYGPLNILALNVGYHNEHHDFPAVAWARLPQVKKLAPEFYDNLQFHTSWLKLWLNFLFDKRYSLFSRMERIQSGKVDYDQAQRKKTASTQEVPTV